MKLTVPGSTVSVPVVASQVDTGPIANSSGYTAFADVTTKVIAAGAGTYTVADVQTGTGGNEAAGWSLVVAYADPTEPLRNLSVFDGLRVVSGTSSVSIPLSGFKTPSAGTVPEVAFDIEKAKQLVADAGGGFDVPLYGINFREGPDYAVLLQNAAKAIGINLDIKLQGDYYDVNWVRTYDPSVAGSDIGITDYGHRGVPDVYLNAALKSFKSVDDGAGVWNAAEFSNAEYDSLVDTYSSSPDLQSQKDAAQKITGILQDEVPMLIGYNINYLSVTKSNVTGVVPTAMGHMFTENAAIG